MKKTKVGKVNQEGNASFVAIYAKGFKPWANNLELSEEQQNTEVPIVLMLNRWDGRVGFIGGNVDNEESLIEAALRESKEEINLSNVNESDLEPIVTHNFKAGSKTLSTHLFVKEVSLEEFSKIQNEIPNSKEFGVEVMGSNKVLIGDFGRGKGFPNFLKSPMATSVREELVELILFKKLVSKDSLKKMCEVAGFNLNDLLLKESNNSKSPTM